MTKKLIIAMMLVAAMAACAGNAPSQHDMDMTDTDIEMDMEHGEHDEHEG